MKLPAVAAAAAAAAAGGGWAKISPASAPVRRAKEKLGRQKATRLLPCVRRERWDRGTPREGRGSGDKALSS